MMKRNENNLFLWTFSLWFAGEIIFNTTLGRIVGIEISLLNNLVGYIVLILLVVQIVFFQTYSQKELIIIGLITSIICISTLCSSSYKLISLWLFIVAAKNVSFEKIIYCTYRILIFMIPIIILLNATGILPDQTMYRQDIVRFSLGFLQPNILGLKIFQLLACHMFLHRDHVKWTDYILAIILILFTYMVPNSMTACIGMFVLMLLLGVVQIIDKFHCSFSSKFLGGMIWGSIFLNIISVILSVINIEKYKALSLLDKLLSVRFSMCHRVFEAFGISVFGQRLPDEIGMNVAAKLSARTFEYLYLDTGYLAILIRFGILIYLLYSIAYIAKMRKCYNQSQYFMLTILFVYALYGIMSVALFELSRNTFLLSFASLLYGKENCSEVSVSQSPQ